MLEAQSHTSKLRILVFSMMVALALGVAQKAYVQAQSTIGTPFAGLLFNPYGSYSDVSLPWWSAEGLGLKYPDRLVSVDGKAFAEQTRYSEFSAAVLRQQLDALRRAGATTVRLRFASGREVERPILTIGLDDAGYFFGIYALIAVFILWTGVMVEILAGRRSGGLAYSAWAVSVSIFLVSFFDYHTTRRLVPWFTASSTGIEVSSLWLAYSFPDPPVRALRPLRALTLVAVLLILALGATLLLAPMGGADFPLLRAAMGVLAPLSFVMLTAATLFRLRGSSGRQRQELLSAIGGLAAVPAFLAVGFLVAEVSGYALVHLMLPLLLPLIPLSIGYSLVRHNILHTTAILTKRLMGIPVFAAALVAAAILSLAAHRLILSHGTGWAMPAALSLVTFVLVGIAGARFSNWLFFPAMAQFRPSIEQLSDELASLQDSAEVQHTVEKVMRQWLPSSRVRVLDVDELSSIAHLPVGYRGLLEAGKRVFTVENPWQRHLLVPMRSLGELRGVLLLAPKHQAALYTSEDFVLLDTIATLSAVALHNASVIAELEQFHRMQVELTRGEKRVALSFLSAEILHEIAYPLNFFRYLLKQGGTDRRLDPQDVEIGREELERLERMVVALRRLKVPRPQLMPVKLVVPVERAVDLLREPIQDRHISVSIEVAPDLTLAAEPDPVVQLFSNLLRNAIQAAGDHGGVGVRSISDDTGLVVEVWDTGPGVPDVLRDEIFNPWISTKEGGAGLGLAISQRIARSFGWSLSFGRQEGRTTFSIRVPKTGDVLSPSSSEAA